MKYHTKTYDSDVLMKNIWRSLACDFRSVLGLDFQHEEEIALNAGITQYRAAVKPPCYLVDYFRFRAKYQLDNIFKRYTFRHDVHQASELEQISLAKFQETQKRIAAHNWTLGSCVSMRSFLVMQAARRICTEILGAYDPNEHFQNCFFGRRAAHGVPFANSHLDRKVGIYELSGSEPQLDWFKHHISSDKLLTDAIETNVPFVCQYKSTAATRLTFVPKTWKALRSIMPNTTVGGFYTSGLGIMIAERLCNVKIDIRRQQQRHRWWIRQYSKDRSHVTADLSAASDSITSVLLRRILPSDWFKALNCGRLSHYEYRGKLNYMETFCTMGMGFTFPLQTLVFYSLLSAIKALLSLKGRISVYGDDLIYPRKMHTHVRAIFGDLGFLLNEEKTYVHESFRESCGADFYCGIDVRPFCPEGQHSMLKPQEYHALCYKTVNGLLRRWEPEEIPQTLHFLFREILRVSDTIYRVPETYPDYAGVKTDAPQCRGWSVYPWSRPKVDAHGTIHFPFLDYTLRDCPVIWQAIYFWDCLREKAEEEQGWNIYAGTEPDVDKLSWVRVKTKPWRSSLTGNRFNHRLLAVYPLRGGLGSYKRKQGQTCVWTEESTM